MDGISLHPRFPQRFLAKRHWNTRSGSNLRVCLALGRAMWTNGGTNIYRKDKDISPVKKNDLRRQSKGQSKKTNIYRLVVQCNWHLVLCILYSCGSCCCCCCRCCCCSCGHSNFMLYFRPSLRSFLSYILCFHFLAFLFSVFLHLPPCFTLFFPSSSASSLVLPLSSVYCSHSCGSWFSSCLQAHLFIGHACAYCVIRE